MGREGETTGTRMQIDLPTGQNGPNRSVILGASVDTDFISALAHYHSFLPSRDLDI